MDKIMVSICIPTYNQCQYISDAIEGCIHQETQHSYEILVRDDCSNDETKEILMYYKNKYPSLIRLILEPENQYSKGKKIFPAFAPYVRGKYVALNEGDDFWIDPNKLEKQINFLETHQDYVLDSHAANVVNDKKEIIAAIAPSNQEEEFTTESIISGNGEMFPTNSFVFKSEFLNKLPTYYFNSYVEDYPLVIFLSTQGKVHYFNEKMSCYREEAKGSWSRSKKTGNVIEKQIKSCEKTIQLLEEINSYYEYKYEACILERIQHFSESIVILSGDIKKLKNEFPFRYNKLSGKEKLIMYFKGHLPKLYNLLKTRMWI